MHCAKFITFEVRRGTWSTKKRAKEYAIRSHLEPQRNIDSEHQIPFNETNALSVAYSEANNSPLSRAHRFTRLTCANGPTLVPRPRRCLQWHPIQRCFLKGYQSPLVWTEFHLSHSVSRWVLDFMKTHQPLCRTTSKGSVPATFSVRKWSRF